jgi:uncharacterized membrane protein
MADNSSDERGLQEALDDSRVSSRRDQTDDLLDVAMQVQADRGSTQERSQFRGPASITAAIGRLKRTNGPVNRLAFREEAGGRRVAVVRNSDGSPTNESWSQVKMKTPLLTSSDLGTGPTTAAVGRASMGRRWGFWVIALSFLAITAFSTTPSPLYRLYGERDHLSSLTITAVYGVYAAGVVVSLLLVGHVSDWYGRRPVLIPSLLVALVAAVVFSVWQTLPGLVVARILTGLAVGAAVATATAHLGDLDVDIAGAPSRRSQIVATVSNIGGLALGPLFAGLIAQYTTGELTVPYLVFIAVLAVAVVLVFFAPEGRQAPRPRPHYRPQRLRLPAEDRSQFIAAVTGVFLCFAVAGLFAGTDRNIPRRATRPPIGGTSGSDHLHRLRGGLRHAGRHNVLAGASTHGSGHRGDPGGTHLRCGRSVGVTPEPGVVPGRWTACGGRERCHLSGWLDP